MTYPEAQLCVLCKPIFTSHWVSQESIQDEAANGFSGDMSDEDAKLDVDEYIVGEYHYTESDFDEKADWVTAVEVDGSTSYQSPRHHSLPELDKSAKSGCFLCTMLFDSIHHRIQQFRDNDDDFVDRLSSVVSAQPHEEQAFDDETIQLEFKFGIDGEIKRGSYAFSIGLILWRCSLGDNILENAFQPPLHHRDVHDPLRRSIGQIKKWLSDCDAEHHECTFPDSDRENETGARLLPTRLLHLQATDEQPSIHLQQTNDLPQHTKYLALSHCWGTSQPVKLLMENYTRFNQSIDFACLPLTFQHAVTLALEIDICYVWVDSLCIIQDSASDWLHEASLMCNVYSNSYLTIAATSSRDGRGGLFHTSRFPSPLVRSCATQATWTGLPQGTYLCVDETAWERRINDAPLNQRAWVLQERLLSPRILHCAYDQMWWTCQEAPLCCEAFPTGTLTTTGMDPTILADLREWREANFVDWNEIWLGIVNAYTKCNLTYGSDKFIAFAGIAQKARRIRGLSEKDYLAGLWRGDILVDLLWRIAGTGMRGSKEYRSPSWSWASVDGEVYFHATSKRVETRDNAIAEIFETHIELVGEWFGPLRDGVLKIRGPIIPAKLGGADAEIPGQGTLQSLELGGDQFPGDDGFTEALDDEGLYAGWPEDGREMQYACLKAMKEVRSDGTYESEGLIVERMDEKEKGYRRIGWMRVWHKKPFLDEKKEVYWLY